MSFRKSLAINFFASSGATLIQFIVSLIVARILTPAEIGVFSIAVVIVAIAHVFREFGVGSYLQRAKDLGPDEVRSALGVAYALAGGIAAIIFASSGFVADWFGYAEITPVMRVLALGFLFIPFSSVPLALLLREYDATKLAVATAAGTAAYSITCIGLALAGFGAVSLAWANLTNILASGIAFLWAKPPNMSYRPRFSDVGGIIRFGSGALLANLVKAGNDAVPDIVLGKIGTARQVGLVSRANSTVHMFTYVAGSAMTFGSQTYLSKAFHAGESIEPILHRAIALVTGVGWPMLAVTAIVAEQVIVTLYGSQWVEAAPAVMPLAFMAAIELAFHYKVSAFNAVGRPALAAIPLLVTAAMRVALGLMLFTGDLVSFAWSLMLATLAAAPFWLFLQRRHLGCRMLPFLAMLLPSAILSGLSAAIAWAALQAVRAGGVESPLITLLLVAVPTGLVWLTGLRVLRHPLWDEIGLLSANLRARFLQPSATGEHK